ncbi:hypothetical protein ABZZ17_26060 [Streptomyces sp. NPDC006512]|uniref:hypothetical protein n=1 Tax=Streptomyces sp. NPDC006512 TaxID=3154307 RepID=UPI0033A867D6
MSETEPGQPGTSAPATVPGDPWERLTDGVVELRKRRPTGPGDGPEDGGPAGRRLRIPVETCGCEAMRADPGEPVPD